MSNGTSKDFDKEKSASRRSFLKTAGIAGMAVSVGPFIITRDAHAASPGVPLSISAFCDSNNMFTTPTDRSCVIVPINVITNRNVGGIDNNITDTGMEIYVNPTGSPVNGIPPYSIQVPPGAQKIQVIGKITFMAPSTGNAGTIQTHLFRNQNPTGDLQYHARASCIPNSGSNSLFAITPIIRPLNTNDGTPENWSLWASQTLGVNVSGGGGLDTYLSMNVWL